MPWKITLSETSEGEKNKIFYCRTLENVLSYLQVNGKDQDFASLTRGRLSKYSASGDDPTDDGYPFKMENISIPDYEKNRTATVSEILRSLSQMTIKDREIIFISLEKNKNIPKE